MIGKRQCKLLDLTNGRFTACKPKGFPAIKAKNCAVAELSQNLAKNLASQSKLPFWLIA
jgi:hypothetical protein